MTDSEQIEREMRRVREAVWRAIQKTRVDNHGIVLGALTRVILDLAMQFPPEQREWVIQGAAGMLTNVGRSAAQHFPEEFGKPTRQ